MNFVELLITFVSGIIVPIVLHYLSQRKKLNNEKKKDIVISHLEIQSKNQEILDNIRVELNSDRVSLFKFSNGTDFLDNTHMLNITMTGESNNNEFPNIKQDFQRVPAYLFDRVLNILKVNEYYVEKNTDLEPGDSLVSVRKTYGLETVIGIKIYDKRGKWIGLITVGFEKTTEVVEETIGWLILKSKSIH